MTIQQGVVASIGFTLGILVDMGVCLFVRDSHRCRRACCMTTEERRVRWRDGEGEPITVDSADACVVPPQPVRDDRKPQTWRPGLTGPC